MRVHRLISILFIVDNQKIAKAKDLAKKLEVSTRTIYRDVDTLCEAGFPLYTTTGPNGGIQFSNNFTLGTPTLNDKDLLPLIIKSIQTTPTHTKSLSEQINANIQIIKKSLLYPNTFAESLTEKIHIDNTPWWGKKRNTFQLKELIDALWSNKTIVIMYRKKNTTDTDSKREIDPYGLILKDVTWYLVGYCHNAQGLRTFKCDNIINVNITNKCYSIPSSFNIKQYWTKSSNAFKQLVAEKEHYPVEVVIDKINGSVLSQFEVYKLIENENKYTAIINLYKFEFAKYEIKKIIGFCQVIKPVELRDFVYSLLIKQLAKYEE